MTLKQARIRAELGVRELGRASGVGKDVVSGIETGRVDPSKVAYGSIVRIVYALRLAGLPGVTADSLFPVEVEP
jgi:predicted transcriptional regulator